MNVNTFIMLGVFLLLGAMSWARNGVTGLLEGLKGGYSTLANVWPLLLLALGIAGFINVLIPKSLVSDFLGPSSGPKGYLVAWGIGAVLPGAPFSILPVAASLLKSGSGVGPIMTMVLSASIGIAATRVPYEIAFVSWEFSLLRILSCFIFPILGGVTAHFVSTTSGLFPS